MGAKCYICQSDGDRNTYVDGRGMIYTVDCPRCGQFMVTDDAAMLMHDFPLTPVQTAVISHFLAQNHRYTITRDALLRLRSMPLPPVAERGDSLLRWVAEKNPIPGEPVPIPYQDRRLWTTIRAVNDNDLLYLVNEYLATEGLIRTSSGEGATVTVKIQPKGWARLDSLRGIAQDSAIGFIAMSFDDSVAPLDPELRRAIAAAGYTPVRVDDRPKDELIVSQILAAIRRSRFVVADFTGQRGGVYFEAGFARGMGIPVFRTCRKDEEKQLHFDVSQFPFRFWEPGGFDDLVKKITDDIVDVVGQGPSRA